MERSSGFCDASRAIRLPASRNGVCGAIRTTRRRQAGEARMCSTSIPKQRRRRPMGLPIRCGNSMVARPRLGRTEVPRRLKPAPRTGMRGFTFVELMVVITIIVILVTMAIPIYSNTIRRSKESVLKQNLFTIRTVIDNYTYDKQKAPQALQDLVRESYLRDVPLDPITGRNDWRIIMADAAQSVNQSEPGIFDVRSSSDKTSLDGTPYSEW